MSHMKSTPLQSLPSESEDSHSTEEENVDESSSEEIISIRKEVPARASMQVPKPPANNQMSEEESESESDSGSEEIAIPSSNSKLNPVPSPAKISTTTMVPWEGTKAKDEKRIQRVNPILEPGEKTEDAKKQLIQRLWSDDDELALLEGACSFRESAGINFVRDIPVFFESIKNEMHFEVSLSQLKDKLWRLRKRYENAIKTGERKASKNDHNRKIFELSRKLWRETADSPYTNGKVKDSTAWAKTNYARIGYDEEKKKLDEIELGGYRFSATDKWILKTGEELIDKKKKRKIHDELTHLQMEELKLYLRKSDIVRDCAKMLLLAHSTHQNSHDQNEDN